ncbi:MAG TPA: plastocyanin/azurin family copper-binding protein, partial [Candidatus Nanoarchaeia archaeon]|nr:plastocyanin/azurin family copper-binding protein [Candidatus Nanoarchaeia archaeon]
MQPAEQTQGTGSEVTIKGFAYSPTELRVTKGTTVTWTNQDSVKHNVAFDSGDVEGPLLAKGESFSYTFDEVGTFAYHCRP